MINKNGMKIEPQHTCSLGLSLNENKKGNISIFLTSVCTDIVCLCRYSTY